MNPDTDKLLDELLIDARRIIGAPVPAPEPAKRTESHVREQNRVIRVFETVLRARFRGFSGGSFLTRAVQIRAAHDQRRMTTRYTGHLEVQVPFGIEVPDEVMRNLTESELAHLLEHYAKQLGEGIAAEIRAKLAVGAPDSPAPDASRTPILAQPVAEPIPAMPFDKSPEKE